MILSYIIFNIWACIAGFKEGILYSKKGSEAFKWNEHFLFVLERAIVFSFLYVGHGLSFCDIVFLLIFCILSFSFWHNGCYYVSRELIDVPKYHFTGSSDTSSAMLELNFPIRIICKIISIIGLVLYIIF